MKHQNTDVAIIGAGPAGLATALTLAEGNYNGSIQVIDAGRHYTKRFCPVDRQGNCNGCGGTCNVIAGFGGCIYYGDGVKLSAFPSGRRLIELLGQERAHDSMQKAIRLFMGKNDVVFHVPNPAEIPLPVKSYPVLPLNSQDVRSKIERLYRLVDQNKQITLSLNTQAISIEPNTSVIDVLCSTGHNDEQITFHAKKVVVAVGRKGFLWWRKELRKLGLIHAAPTFSIGLRFECPREYLVEAGRLHPDYKTSIYENGMKFKTFCFCAGDGGGRLKFANYGSFTLLDGHIIPEENEGTQAANFALLLSLRDEDGNPRSFEWIEKQVLIPYRSLNVNRPGKPVIQWYPDFKNRTMSCTDMNSFIRTAGFTPSVSDIAFANLASILPNSVHAGFCGAFERLFSTFCELSGKASDKRHIAPFTSHVGVVGLELEGLWDKVQVTPLMQSSIQNLYVVGDCAGVAQGILQAMTSGVVAASGIMM